MNKLYLSPSVIERSHIIVQFYIVKSNPRQYCYHDTHGFFNSLIWNNWINWNSSIWLDLLHIWRVSCQKGPTHHVYAWQIGPFWQDNLELCQGNNTVWIGQQQSKLLQFFMINCEELTDPITHIKLNYFNLIKINHHKACLWISINSKKNTISAVTSHHTADVTCILNLGVTQNFFRHF